MLYTSLIICPGLLRNVRYDIICHNYRYRDIFTNFKNHIREFEQKVFADNQFILRRQYSFIVDLNNRLKLIAPMNFTRKNTDYFFYVNLQDTIFYFIKGQLKEDRKFQVTYFGLL